VLIDVLLVVGDDGLGDGLTDGVDLGSVTTTGDTDTDVDTSELVNADDQEGLVDLKNSNMYRQKLFPFVASPVAIVACSSMRIHVVVGGAEVDRACAYLEAEDLGLDQGEGLAVNLDEALALLL
jgi:hypothetical protein